MDLNKPAVLEERRSRVAELYLAGHTLRVIGEKLGISHVTAWYDLQEVRKQWREDAVKDYDDMVTQECHRLDAIFREAWEGWRRSQENEESKEVRTNEFGTFEVFKTKGQAGSAAFLNTAKDAIKAKCELLRLDAPQKHEVTTGLQVVIDEDFFGNAARFTDGICPETDAALREQ